MVDVIEAGGALDEFISLPLQLYRDDAHYVPQLTRDLKEHFSSKNPFFQYARPRYFIARKDGRACGRIAAFVNSRHNDFHHEKAGFFGFYESVNDRAVAKALIDAASAHLKSEGAAFMRGPMNFSTNEECGFVFEGFDGPPMIMMPYNPPYYNDLMEGCGLGKIRDLYAYIHEVADALPEKVQRVARIVEQKGGLTVRHINMKKFGSEMMIFKDVYNSAWRNNWGFIPLTDEELRYMAARLKQIIVPELTVIAEKDGQPAAFMGIIPDFNFVLRRMNGRLNPITIAKALYYSRRIEGARLLLMGVKEAFRNKGVEALLYRQAFPHVRGKYRRVEFSWILEDNTAVQKSIEIFDGRLYRKYRIYEKSL